MTIYPFVLFMIGLLFAIASFPALLEGYKRTSQVLQVLAIIHIAPLLIMLWSRMLLGSE